MTTSEIEQPDKVVPLRARKATRASERKWSKPVMDLGFCMVPSLLLRAQARLGLDARQLAVLMHLADFWWDADRKPFPSKRTLAERLRLSPRQVQRIIAELEAAGFVKRNERFANHKGKLTNEYDLDGLVKRLKQLEPEFRQADAEAKATRRKVAQPGFRRRADKAG